MTALVLLLAAFGVFVGFLAVLAAIADAIGEPERWDSRRRNGR